MAKGNTRDVTLTLSVDALGEDNVRKLQAAIQGLAKEGDAAAPEFQKLADEVQRLGQQNQALQAFKALGDETAQLRDRVTEVSGRFESYLSKLNEAKAAATEAKVAQKQASQAFDEAREAQTRATAALKAYRQDADAATRQTAAYEQEVKRLRDAETEAKVAVDRLRTARNDANKAVTEAVSAQDKLQTSTERAEVAAAKASTALHQQEAALNQAKVAAEALGASTDNVAEAEVKLLGAFNQAGAAASSMVADLNAAAAAEAELSKQSENAARELAERNKYAQESYAADMRMAEAAQKAAAAMEKEAQAAAALAAKKAEQAESDRLAIIQLNGAEAARQRGIIALEAEMAAQRDAAALTKRLADERAAAEAKIKQAADEAANAARASAKAINDAYGTVGVRGIQEVEHEIKQVRDAMGTLAASGRVTGQALNVAFAAGEARIKLLEREIRGLNGTLSMADKTAALFKNSLGQIAAGNLVADGVGYIVNKIKDMGREMVVAIVQLETFRRSLNAIYKDSTTTASQLDFLRKTANASGIAVGSISDSFVKFSAAMKFANVPLQQSNELFAAVTRAAGTLGLSGERTTLMLDALGQMASKGVVSMEELRQQLGDSLPGALSLTAQGLGLTDAELIKLVESGQLASRDMFPALTRALTQLHGETTGITPTWERFKNMLTQVAQDVGDAGGIETITLAIRALAAVVAVVIVPLNTLAQGFLAVGRAVGAAAGALATGQSVFNALADSLRVSLDRVVDFTVSYAKFVVGMDEGSAAANTNAVAMVKVTQATDNLTRSEQAAAVAAKLAADSTLDLGTKTVQLSVALSNLIPAQEKETLMYEKLAKAADDQGKTLVALAKLRGDQQGVLDAEAAASEKLVAAQTRVSESRKEELRLLEIQRTNILSSTEATGKNAEELKKLTAAQDTKIESTKAEIEQSDALVQKLKQEAEARKLTLSMYGDQSAKMAEYRAEMDRLTKVLAEYERLALEGKKSEDQVLAVRKQLSEATARYRDTVDDLIGKKRLEAEASIATLEANRSDLNMQAQLATEKAKIARLRGDNTTAMRLEREAQQLLIEAAKVKLQIDEVQAKLEIELLKIRRDSLDTNDALYRQKLQEIELKIKLQEITLKEVEAGRKLIDLKKEENNLRNTNNTGLGNERASRGSVITAVNNQSDAIEKLMMKYKLSADYSERQIQLLEREAAAAEKAAEAYRKKWNVDKDGFTLDNNGERMGQFVVTPKYAYDTAKSQGLDDATALRMADKKWGNPSALHKEISDEALAAARRRVQDEQRAQFDADLAKYAGKQKRQAETSVAPPKDAPSGGSASGASSGASRPQSVTINVNNRPRTLNLASPQDTAVLRGVLRELENAGGTAS